MHTSDVTRVEVSAWDRAGSHVKVLGELFQVNEEVRLLVRADLPLGAIAFLRVYSTNGSPEVPMLRMFHIARSRRARRRGFRILTLIPVQLT